MACMQLNCTHMGTVGSALVHLSRCLRIVGLSLDLISISGSAWSLYKCMALWGAVSGASATESPLGTIRQKKGGSSPFWLPFSSQYDVSCGKRVKIHSFLYTGVCLPMSYLLSRGDVRATSIQGSDIMHVDMTSKLE